MSCSGEETKTLDVDSSCFVFASAGSGKTKTLVDRYIKSLLLGVEPQNILCITYSNAAVCEIENRVENALKELYLAKNVNEYVKDKFNLSNISDEKIKRASKLFFKLQDNLSQLKILTIHSFCQSLLMQFPMEAEILPNFMLLDDFAAKALMQQAKDTCLKAVSDNVVQKLSKSMSLRSFEDLIEKIYQERSKFIDFFKQYDELNDYKAIAADFLHLTPLRNFTLEQKKFIDEKLSHESLEKQYLTKGGLRKRIPFPKEPISRQIADTVFENYQNKNKEKTLEETFSYLQLVKQIIDEYQRLKNEQNVLDFTDVLYKTKYLLTQSCTKEFVISKICSQIKSIMVDEAQDLSPIQWDLIRIFAGDILSNPHSRRNIFVVGDIKQSIYRFQGADCNLFSEFYEEINEVFHKFNKKLEVSRLDKNYRSLPKILETVDTVFDGAEANNLGGASISYQRHTPFRQDETGKTGHVEVIVCEDMPPEVEDKMQYKAQKIAEKIAECADNNSIILTRNRDDLSQNIMENLGKFGVKIAPPEQINLVENDLITDILSMADLCINRDNDFAMYCILKSPYIFKEPLTNYELYNICIDKTISIFDKLNMYFPEKYKYVNKLISYYDESELPKFFYLLSTNLHNISAHEKHILSSFLDEVIKFSNNNSQSLSEFLEFFRENDIEVKNSLPVDADMRLLTIHGSKGLQADTVFLLDFKLNADKAKLSFLFSDKLFFIKPSEKYAVPELQQIIDHELDLETRELYRLLYVAMTRAKNNLYIILPPKEPKDASRRDGNAERISTRKTACSLIQSKLLLAETRYS
ncbi:MAG: UvrD-helicase domain-containing protein [Alphaproteobacteria bacterium]|nr:UvrD-helicase domain-containing protein [Alphaproteobacteria bacterium]